MNCISLVFLGGDNSIDASEFLIFSLVRDEIERGMLGWMASKRWIVYSMIKYTTVLSDLSYSFDCPEYKS
jgi:hypothetical protein